MKRNFYRLQKKGIPKAPKTVQDILTAFSDDEIMQSFGETKRTEKTVSRKFYKAAVEHDNFSFCIFASDNIIALIEKFIPAASRNFLMDATFKIVPEGCFNQILIIYIEYTTQVITLVIYICELNIKSVNSSY